MATKTSEKVLITGLCLLTTVNLAAHYQNERRETIRAEADALREQRVVDAIAAAQVLSLPTYLPTYSPAQFLYRQVTDSQCCSDTLQKVCFTAIRQKRRLSHQLHHMRNMSPYSQEFSAAFEKLGRIMKDTGVADDGGEGGENGSGGGKREKS
ncbi:hypothetical protein F4813DRAFT_385728 [Daldinia decipiens]|uniref:uncharacterized protein n=1 Tax=Daldinia decipiens TaxID=326647 RepID=UPI0020C311C4|nr:uncharacterized protein F4813DRAFT_385728 [Daldinia decipiens]KAI1661194.1 hypothetical protein F4813DRAFT_385728 [Daldinia decipiens]